MNVIGKGYSYDDVYIIPKYSNNEFQSRSDINVYVNSNVASLTEGISTIIPANMKDIIDVNSAKVFLENHCLTILHRFDKNPVENQINIFAELEAFFKGKLLISDFLACSVGLNETEKELKELAHAGFKIFCIDVAHGHTKHVLDRIKLLKTYAYIIIAGNVVTYDATLALIQAGADLIKVGIGPGSICTTRKETGVGYPQLSALSECRRAVDFMNTYENCRMYGLIADGGIKSPGDVVKALCFADFVMIGGMLSACSDTPGEIHHINGVDCKAYHGSSTYKGSRSEGTVIYKKVSSTITETIEYIHEKIQSGLSYVGHEDINDLLCDKDIQFIEVSQLQSYSDQNKETIRKH
jgi:IMP dehydrogenase/GMP reductase